MSYQEKSAGFDSLGAFNGRVKHANQVRDNMLLQWRAAYDGFWKVPLVQGDNALSMEDLQAVLDEDQAVIGNILTDSAAFLAFATTNYPEGFGEEALIPPRYLSSPYEVSGTIGVDLTLVSLKPEWAAPEELA